MASWAEEQEKGGWIERIDMNHATTFIKNDCQTISVHLSLTTLVFLPFLDNFLMLASTPEQPLVQRPSDPHIWFHSEAPSGVK